MPDIAPRPTAATLFVVFTKIGLSSFGGGLSGWMMREFVTARAWLSQEEFLNGLALAQAFPGVNAVNLAIWIGYRLRGSCGALVSALGIIALPGVVIVAIATGFASLSQYPLAHWLLDGIGAAAVGLALSLGLMAGRAACRGVVPVVIMALAFVAVGLLGLPMPLVVIVLSPISVGVAYWRLPRVG